MTTIVDKIRKRIKEIQLIEGKIIEAVQITQEEFEQLGGRTEIDNVKLIVVKKLENIVKTDCFAYITRNGNSHCYCLNRLYCIKEKCNFYKKRDADANSNILEIEKSIKEYAYGKEKV